jgi:uncharacterized membrane protein
MAANTTLTVWKFATPDGARMMEQKLVALQKQLLINVHDAAIVEWPEGKSKPKTRQVNSLTGAGALSGAFWGMLFGLLFFAPFLGLAIGAAMGALAGKFSDYGIDDNFINQVRDEVTPGTSALFVMTSGAVVDRVLAEVKSLNPELISTNLSAEQEEALRAAFAEDETPPAEEETPAAE